MATRQYIGARYVPKFYQNSVDGSAQWESNVVYEPLMYVTLTNGHMYISRKQVPATVGSPVDNIEYWLDVANYNGYISQLQAEIDDINNVKIPAVQTSIAGKQDATDNNLDTTDKTVVGAINEVNTAVQSVVTSLADKQDKTDNNLTTTDKTVVGAINELADAIEDMATSVIVTPEMYGAVGDGVVDDTTAVQSALTNGNFIICSKTYKITNTLFIEGDKTICGGGTLLGYLPETETDEYLLILGNPSIGENGEKFTGTLRDITFKCYTGNYNYIVCGGNSDNVLVDNCIFDSSNGNCHNKMLFFGDNDAVCPISNDNELTNYSVSNSKFIYDATQDGNNACESVGCSFRNNINIENNVVYYADDDLGFHQCSNVTIRNNRMLNNYVGRIYVSNSKYVKILNNEIVQNGNTNTMGIYVCWETSAVSATMTPSDFEIVGNVIDYSNDELTTPTYGIRCTGVRGKIHDNYLIGTYPYNGRIVVENQAASGSLTSLLVSDDIDIYNNTCTELFESGTGSTSADDVNINIYNNVCDSIYSFYISNQVHHNRVSTSIYRSYDMEYVPYNMLWQFEGTGTGSPQSMNCNGLTSFRFNEKVMLSNYIGFTTDVDVPLSDSDYYRLSFYKNGDLIRHVTLQEQDYTETNFNSVTFDAGDVLSVGYSFSGTVPSTQPSIANVQLKYFSFADFCD